MKYSEIQDFSVEEIDDKLLNSKKELFNLRVQLKNQKLEQVHRISVIKKDVARLLTLKSKKQQSNQEKQQ